jgi:hypothetical protein
MVHEVECLKAKPTVPGSMGAIAKQQRRSAPSWVKKGMESLAHSRFFLREEPLKAISFLQQQLHEEP